MPVSLAGMSHRLLPVIRPFEVTTPLVVRTQDLTSAHARRGARPIYYGYSVVPDPAQPDHGPARRRHDELLALVTALASAQMDGRWFCYEAAALVWGCFAVDLGRYVDVNQPFTQRRSPDARIRRHHSVIPEDQLEVVDGIPVTTLARTVVDCARALPAHRALVIADSAVRAGLREHDVHRCVESLRGGRGIRRARWLLTLVDGGSESPGETLTRLALIEAGLPRPVTQVPVHTAEGMRYGDMGWPDRRVLVEFDGRVKYADGHGSGGAAALIAEKRRQEAIEDAGWIVLRVMWEDLRTPERLTERVLSAFHRARLVRLATT